MKLGNYCLDCEFTIEDNIELEEWVRNVHRDTGNDIPEHGEFNIDQIRFAVTCILSGTKIPGARFDSALGHIEVYSSGRIRTRVR